MYTKAKFNAERILYGTTNYPKDFIELVKRYKDQVINVIEEPFGGYELELEGKTYGLYDEEIIVIKE